MATEVGPRSSEPIIRSAKVYDAALMLGHLYALKESRNSMQFTTCLKLPGITPDLDSPKCGANSTP
jgi:hypothetical protein